ncbi:hypothetical protein QV65_08260 [Rhodococcus erythropolis]|nr:hypothetical protein QV65_08260 [Rhodococcus erythropolis]
MSRSPPLVVTLTMSPTVNSDTGWDFTNANEPVGIAGDIEPDRKTTGLMPNANDSAVATMHRTPRTAPVVRAACLKRLIVSGRLGCDISIQTAVPAMLSCV